MFLEEFNNYIKKEKIEKDFVLELYKWIKNKSLNKSLNKKDKIFKSEFFIGKNKNKDFLIIGNSEIGRNTLLSLYNYAESLDNQNIARWTHLLKPKDFR